MEYIFDITPINIENNTLELSKCLKKYVELNSRKKFPQLWNFNDKFNSSNNQSKPRSKVRYIIFLALGIFLIVPGIMKPQELILPLIAGIVGILAGIYGLMFLTGNNNHKRFVKSSVAFLKQNENIPTQKYKVKFDENKMTLTDIDEDDHTEVLYSKFKFTFETNHLYVIIFEERILVLQKRDLLDNLKDFHSFLDEKTKIQYV